AVAGRGAARGDPEPPEHRDRGRDRVGQDDPGKRAPPRDGRSRRPHGALRDPRRYARAPVCGPERGPAPHGRRGGSHAPDAGDHAAPAGPHHRRRSPGRRSARAPEGVEHRASGGPHDGPRQQRRRGADAARRAAPGGRRPGPAAGYGPPLALGGAPQINLASLSGPVAHILITVAVIIPGLVFAFSGHGSGARPLFGVGFGGAIALGALSFMTAVGWAGATF